MAYPKRHLFFYCFERALAVTVSSPGALRYEESVVKALLLGWTMLAFSIPHTGLADAAEAGVDHRGDAPVVDAGAVVDGHVEERLASSSWLQLRLRRLQSRSNQAGSEVSS